MDHYVPQWLRSITILLHLCLLYHWIHKSFMQLPRASGMHQTHQPTHNKAVGSHPTHGLVDSLETGRRKVTTSLQRPILATFPLRLVHSMLLLAPLLPKLCRQGPVTGPKRRKQNPLGISCFRQEVILYSKNPRRWPHCGRHHSLSYKTGRSCSTLGSFSLLPGPCWALHDHLLNETELSGHFLLHVFTSP